MWSANSEKANCYSFIPAVLCCVPKAQTSVPFCACGYCLMSGFKPEGFLRDGQTDGQTDNYVYGGLIPADCKPPPSHLLTSPRGLGETIKKDRSEIKKPKGRDKNNGKKTRKKHKKC